MEKGVNCRGITMHFADSVDSLDLPKQSEGTLQFNGRFPKEIFEGKPYIFN